MFGYVLTFTVCSIVQGAACHDLPPIPLQPNVGPLGCMIASQVEGARRVANHPNFYVQRATCQPFNKYAKA